VLDIDELVATEEWVRTEPSWATEFVEETLFEYPWPNLLMLGVLAQASAGCMRMAAQRPQRLGRAKFMEMEAISLIGTDSRVRVTSARNSYL